MKLVFVVVHREVSHDWQRQRKVRLDIKQVEPGIVPDMKPAATDLHLLNLPIDHPYAHLSRGDVLEIGICGK